MKVRHVLFPTDFSDSARRALGRAVAIAAQYGAKLTLLHIVVPHAEDTADPETRFPSPAEMHALKPDTAKGELDAEVVTTRGYSAADKILSFADANDVDLIVMGSHGRRGFSRALLGSEAERVLRLATCPVLTVSEKMERGLDAPAKRILIPIDFSPPSEEALRAGLSLAQELGASVDVVHVFDEPVVPPFLMDHTGSYISTDPKMRDRCLESMDKHLAAHPFEGRVEKHVLEGRLVPTLRKLAEEKGSDLIVIGTRGLSGLDFILLGSTASHLLRVAPCPVLTVRGPEETSGD